MLVRREVLEEEEEEKKSAELFENLFFLLKTMYYLYIFSDSYAYNVRKWGVHILSCYNII